jgi:hypothetical protein
MSVECEDNFGFYCTDNDTEELAFFRYATLQSKPKICMRCHQNVRCWNTSKYAQRVRKHWNMARRQIQLGQFEHRSKQ